MNRSDDTDRLAQHHRKQPKPPAELKEYLEAMTRIVLQSGMNWRVIEAKWPGIQDAFRGFDPERVARMTSRDIAHLMTDRRVIRNMRKLEAIVANAKEMLTLDKAPGGFRSYLRSHRSIEDRVTNLQKDFRFLGFHGAYYFLWSVGEKVPSWQEWSGGAARERMEHVPRRRRSRAETAKG